MHIEDLLSIISRTEFSLTMCKFNWANINASVPTYEPKIDNPYWLVESLNLRKYYVDEWVTIIESENPKAISIRQRLLASVSDVALPNK